MAGIAIGGAAGYALHGSAPAAKSAAASFFALYSAGQWQAAWRRLVPADQKIAPEKLYVDFHDACPSEAAGLA